MSAPAKAPATRAQRSGVTDSFSQVAASSVTSTGVSMLMAVNSATGRYCTPKKLIAEVASSRVPRRAWKRGWALRKRSRGDRASHTVMTEACIA